MYIVRVLYKIHWIMRTFACLPCKVVCHWWLIQQLDIIIALIRTVLTSGQPFSQLETRLRSALQHGYALPPLQKIHPYRKYTFFWLTKFKLANCTCASGWSLEEMGLFGHPMLNSCFWSHQAHAWDNRGFYKVRTVTIHVASLPWG